MNGTVQTLPNRWRGAAPLGCLLALLVATAACIPHQDEPQKNCGTPATLRDLRGLDGCGWVLELDNGKRLNPQLRTQPRCGNDSYYGSDEYKALLNSPLRDFALRDGKRVNIGYRVVPEVATTCMVGEVVEITCITEVPVVLSNAQ